MTLDTFEAIRQRRAVKRYDPAHRLSAEEEKTLLDLAQYSPSSFNIQHWRIVKVSDPELRKKIRAAAWDQAQVTEASLLLIICADMQAWQKKPERYWEKAAVETRDLMVPAIKGFYQSHPELQRDEALRSVGIISQTLMLAAKAMGYDSCPMIGFEAQKVAALINLPEDHLIGMMLAIGKAQKSANPRAGHLPLAEVLFENGF